MSSLVRSPIPGLARLSSRGLFTSVTRSPDGTGVRSSGPVTGPPLGPRTRTIVRRLANAPRPVQDASDLAAAAALTLALGLPLLMIPIWAAALAVSGRRSTTRTLGETARKTVLTAASALALGSAVAYLAGLVVPRPDLLTAVACFALASGLVNSVPVIARRAGGHALTRAVLVGSFLQVHRLLDELSRAGGQQLRVVGLCLTDSDLEQTDLTPGPPGIEVTRGLANIGPALQCLEADTLVVAPGPDIGPLELRRLGWQAERLGARLHVDSGLVDTALSRTQVIAAGSARLVDVSATAPAPFRRAVKAVWEWTLAVLLLLASLPILAVLTVAIRADRGGPALFRQTRVGLDGREFTLIKLRTMRPDAEQLLEDLSDLNETDGVLFKIRADPRVTRVGAFLRKYSIDELPQLWNVIRGDMALVGPRPALPSEVANYAHDTHRRLAVKPGLTGLWQVSGRSNLSWEETIRIDLEYVDNWSLTLDSSIVVRTAKAVIGHQGAY